MRKFYKTVAVEEQEGSFILSLDDKHVRLPDNDLLRYPTKALAALGAEEWEKQDNLIDPETMPLHKIMTGTKARTEDEDTHLRARLCRYAETDLLCYRADLREQALCMEQARSWDPVLAHYADVFGLGFRVVNGVLPVAQEPILLKKIAARIDALSSLELTLLFTVTEILGSLLLGLAWYDKIYDVADLFAKSRVDDCFQIERWGADPQDEAIAQEKEAFLEKIDSFYTALGGENENGTCSD